MSRSNGDPDPIRVLRVITRLNIGGPSIQAITLSDGLASRGLTTRLVFGRLSDGEGDMQYLLPPATVREQIDTLRRPIAPLPDVRTLARLLAIMREYRPQIVHTHMAKAGTLGRLAAALYNRTAGRGARARTVHTYHGHVLDGYFGPVRSALFVGVERLLAPFTDRIVAISPSIRDQLLHERHIGRIEQYRVIPLGFDLGGFSSIDDRARLAAREQLGIPADRHVVSTVGRLTAIKDHRLFLEAARLVAGGDPAALFLIVGDGELRHELERTASACGVADRTRFLGWRRDLTTIYGATDVFLLTSLNEGTPVALIESLAAAVPGVSTDVGGVRDVIGAGEVGLLAPPGDAAALAGCVLRLLRNPAERQTMGGRGRQSVVSRFGLTRLIDDVEALYRELVS